MVALTVAAVVALFAVCAVWLPTVPLRAALRDVPAAQAEAASRPHLPVDEVDDIYEQAATWRFKGWDWEAMSSPRRIVPLALGMALLMLTPVLLRGAVDTEFPAWFQWVLYVVAALYGIGVAVLLVVSQIAAARCTARAVRLEATLTDREETLGRARYVEQQKKRLREYELELAQKRDRLNRLRDERPGSRRGVDAD